MADGLNDPFYSCLFPFLSFSLVPTCLSCLVLSISSCLIHPVPSHPSHLSLSCCSCPSSHLFALVLFILVLVPHLVCSSCSHLVPPSNSLNPPHLVLFPLVLSPPTTPCHRHPDHPSPTSCARPPHQLTCVNSCKVSRWWSVTGKAHTHTCGYGYGLTPG